MIRLRLTRLSLALLAIVAALVVGGASASAQTPSTARGSTTAATVWLCRPGLASDPCSVSLSTTALAASGSTSLVRETTVGASSKFDCFYVYPTVSKELSTNADLSVGKAEIAVAEAQAAPFSQVCRVWAPIYRQRTLISLLAGLGSDPQANVVAYDSVLSAWQDYLAHDNDGRPFVLIGHSQGAAMLIDLMRTQIDNDPSLRARLVSAIVLGGNVQVPSGRLVGGTFQHVPGCSSSSETGCVIAYSSFPTTPPSDSFFGRPGQGVSLQSGQQASKGEQVLCTNPAALGGGSAALIPRFLTITLAVANVSTPWVEFPGLYTARCEGSGGATWLNVTSSSASSDTRPRVTEEDGPQWGYHVDDVSLALGNLVADVASEESSYTKHS